MRSVSFIIPSILRHSIFSHTHHSTQLHIHLFLIINTAAIHSSIVTCPFTYRFMDSHCHTRALRDRKVYLHFVNVIYGHLLIAGKLINIAAHTIHQCS